MKRREVIARLGGALPCSDIFAWRLMGNLNGQTAPKSAMVSDNIDLGMQRHMPNC
jgi:hypothetical protein